MQLFDDSGGSAAVNSSKGVCLYGGQAGSGEYYKVTNVMDFSFGRDGLEVTNKGIDAEVILDEQLGQLAYMMYERYVSGENDISGGDYVGSMIYSLIRDGYIRVEGTFMQESNKVSYVKKPSNEAKEYGINASSYKEITVNNAESAKVISHDFSSGDTILGPFNVTYGDWKYGIDSINIHSDQKDWTDSSGGQIYYSTSLTEWSNVLSNIPSNKDFYIKISDSGEEFNKGSNLTVTINQAPIEYIRAKLVFATSNGYSQQIAFFAAEKQNYTGSVTVNVTNTPIDLTVVKSGKNNTKQSNVEFFLSNGVPGQAYAHWGSQEEQNGTMVYSNITFKEWTDENTQIFKTGSNGKFIVKDLDPSYTYYLQETTNPNPNYTNIDIKSANLSNGVANVKLSNIDSSNKTTKNWVTDIKLSTTQENVLEIIDREEGTFEINITKTSSNGKTKVSGAEFKVKVTNKNNKVLGWLRRTSEGKYVYDAEFKNSSTWSTSTSASSSVIRATTSGLIEISDLSKEYKYQIYETKAATGYYALSQQINRGMKVEIEGDKVDNIKYISAASNSTESNDYAATIASIYCGTVSYSSNNPSVEILATNNKPTGGGGGGPSPSYLKISGNIWIDEPSGKSNVYDDLYNNNDEELYKGSVKVSLINSSGRTVTSTTTTSGKYTLTNTGIRSSTSVDTIANRLEGYYIKFEYDKNYSTTAPKFEEQNGSKALISDKDGEAYIYNLDDYVKTFYKSPTLQYMNLGLVKTSISEYEMHQNIAYVKVVMNGYTYTYEYGGTGDTLKTSAPTVKWIYDGDAYSRAIYPSDIAYSKENDWDDNSLKVYVVYRIDIKNNNLTNYKLKKEDVNSKVDYVEVDLKLTSLVNDFDSKTYELETNYDSSSMSDFKDWKEDGTGKAVYTGNKLDNGILPDKTLTIYTEFKVKKEALEQLLDKEERAEEFKTQATSIGYHNYWKADYVWVERNNERVQELQIQDRKTDNQTKKAHANYLKLYINTERTITGTVFEDENIYTNGEVIGDSMYGTNKDGKKENTIKNVKVELIAENGKVAKIYNSSKKYAEEDANSTSDVNGTYSFVGVTPGKYYVRFTYGDGTQKICSIGNDNQYKETESTVSLKDYKSTVVTNPYAASALGYKENKDFIYDNETDKEQWYKDLDNTIYSVATDNLDQREEYNNDNNSRNNIEANTALMSVTLENTEGNFVTITKSEDGTKEKISGINFGIIEIPEISVAFDKVVSNIEITNAQGNIIVQGNPATKNIKYVSDLDGEEHLVDGSQYVKSEINEQELYGSSLKLTYSITVQNNSEVNYYEDEGDYYGYYYKFGDHSKSNEVTITIDHVLDFLDPKVKYESIDNNHKVTELNAADKQDIVNEIQNKTQLTYTSILDVTNWKELKTTKYTDEGGHSKEETQDTAVLVATRLLSAQDDDLGVSNVAQVTELHVTNNPKLIEKIDSSSRYFNHTKFVNPTEEIYTAITPPTGVDMFTIIIYVVSGIAALAVLTTGIIIIKKKVLKK